MQTPFEANESIFLSTDGRAMQKEEKSIKSRFKVGERQDPEIQAETNKGNTVNILYDSSYYSLLTS